MSALDHSRRFLAGLSSGGPAGDRNEQACDQAEGLGGDRRPVQERLPASVAAIGTMAVPVIGVMASAVALHEPLGPGQIAALVFTLAGVALAARS